MHTTATSGKNETLPQHQQEWINSKVSEEIITLNVRSFTDARDVDSYLNRNTDRRWKHSTDLVPGWGVFGVDPKTGERDFSSFQYKADKPALIQGGLAGKKPPKYLTPSGQSPTPIFLDKQEPQYWPGILKDTEKAIYIVEGAKKAGCLLSLGLPAIAITGCYNGAPGNRLNDQIAMFCQEPRPVFLVPDGDWRDNFHVGNGWSRLGQLIEKRKCPVSVVVWDESYKGIDDYAAAGGDVMQAVSAAVSFKDWKTEIKEIQKEANAGYPVLTQERIVPLLEQKLGDKLRLNLLTQTIEYQGIPLDTDIAYLAIGGEYGYRINKELCNDALLLVAKRHEYNPVAEYLEELQEPQTRVDINKLATRYLGTADPLYDTFIKKFLIGAVARALQPGCKVDTALILQGPQGIGKSSFFRALGGPWFDDSMGPLEGKDDVMTLHRAWIHEWGELEFLTGKKQSSEIKQFLSRAIDRFRPPYGRYVKEFPRRSVICGTTNQTDFLRDETGNRRFWVIPVAKGSIDLEALERDRDAIWYEAVLAYRAGEKWWLTPEESGQSESRNQAYLPSDPWEVVISEKLKTNRYSDLKTEDILTDWLGIDKANQNTAHARRVARIMESLGYKQERRRGGGKRERIWVKVAEPSEQSQETPPPRQGIQDCPAGSVNGAQEQNHLAHRERSVAQMAQISGPPNGASGPPLKPAPSKDSGHHKTPLAQMAQMIQTTSPKEKISHHTGQQDEAKGSLNPTGTDAPIQALADQLGIPRSETERILTRITGRVRQYRDPLTATQYDAATEELRKLAARDPASNGHAPPGRNGSKTIAMPRSADAYSGIPPWAIDA